MIIDNHVHVFPDQQGPAGYPDVEAYARKLQAGVGNLWGKMVSSHVDRKYLPEPDEDVGFHVGRYGRWQWSKHGEDCWLQRGPVSMSESDHTPEQMLAHMDFVGVEVGIIQVGYVEPDYGRDVFYADVIKRYPDRLLGMVDLNYDLSQSDEFLQGEIRKLTHAVEELGFRGLDTHVPRGQPVDDPRCEPLWREVVRLGIPLSMNTGFNSKEEYLDEIKRIGDVLRKHPEMNGINNCLGHNVLHPNNPNHTDNPREFFHLFELGNFYFEVGYSLIFENEAIWGREFEYPSPRHEQIIKAIYENFGAGALVWGSDMPWTQRLTTYKQCLDLVRLHTDFMTEKDRALVLGGNLARIYQIDDRDY